MRMRADNGMRQVVFLGARFEKASSWAKQNSYSTSLPRTPIIDKVYRTRTIVPERYDE